MATKNDSAVPAFYALPGTRVWHDYVNLLHLPYTLWNSSIVVIGTSMAPVIHVDRLLGTLLAFFLAVGVAAHALDELNGRPMGTRIPSRVLVGLAVVSLVGAMALGILAGVLESPWLFAFVAFGGFIVVAYNLGLWNDRFHNVYWLAFSWGAFPILTAYWVQAERLDFAVVLVAGACFLVTLVQRTLSTPVRLVRRRAVRVEGFIELADGERIVLDGSRLISASERALFLLAATFVVLAAGLLVGRFVG
jgi:hypothetical protein